MALNDLNQFIGDNDNTVFGLGSTLDNLQDSLTIKGGTTKKGYTLDIHPSYDAEQTLDAQFRNAYDLKPENRIRRSMFMDPFIPNFKIMIDYDKPYGLFAKEEYPNSALAYIARVFGKDSTRYMMLNNFIEQFKTFIKEYDFLILNVEGLEELYTIYNKHTFVEESEIKCNVIVRETVTMQLIGLINLYNLIWFDVQRGVEVLPENLRRFDLYILIFNAGYFNSYMYDLCNPVNAQAIVNDDDAYQRNLFPTVYKLERLRQMETFNLPNIEFNSYIFHMIDAQLDMLESGKKMFSDITNEMSGEYVKNNLSFTARFINTKGRFDQVDKGIDLSTLLAMENASKNQTGKSLFKGWAKKLYTSLKTQGIDIINNSIGSVFGTVKGLLNKTSPIGNALNLLASPEEISKKLGNAVNVAVNGMINKYVDAPANWLQSMVEQNFRSDILTDLMHDATDNFFGTGQDQLREIENYNDLKDKIPAAIDYASDNFKVSSGKIESYNEPPVGTAKTIELEKKKVIEQIKKDDKQDLDKTEKINIKIDSNIPDYNSPENKNNLEIKKTINEFLETKNHNNIEVEPEIPDYNSPENKNNLEVKKTINEFLETKNHNNIEVEPEIPDYNSPENKNNLEVKETISEYQETENHRNIEVKPEIPEYNSPTNKNNLTYEELIEIFGKFTSKSNIEVQQDIPDYNSPENHNNLEVKETINEYQETTNRNNIEVQQDIPDYNSPENHNNLEVKETINEYQETTNHSNIEQTDSISSYGEFNNKQNLEIVDNIDNMVETKNNNNIEYSDPISLYPSTDINKQKQNPEYSNPINPNNNEK